MDSIAIEVRQWRSGGVCDHCAHCETLANTKRGHDLAANCELDERWLESIMKARAIKQSREVCLVSRVAKRASAPRLFNSDDLDGERERCLAHSDQPQQSKLVFYGPS